MTAITDLSDLVNRATGGSSGAPENVWFHKTSRVAGAAPTAPTAGRMVSLWRFDGQPAGGATPTTVAVPDNTTAGGLLQTDPAGGRQKWMTHLGACGLAGGTLVLYDRLLHIGSLDGTVITAQTVGGSLTRYTSGAGNFAFAEVYTTVGATGRTITMSYSNTTPTSGRTSIATTFGGTGFREDTRAVLMPLQSGDTGISAVASVTISATTGTAGNFGVTVGHPLAYVPLAATSGGVGWRDFTTGLPGFPEVLTDACLAFLFLPQTVTVPEFFGSVSFVES